MLITSISGGLCALPICCWRLVLPPELELSSCLVSDFSKAMLSGFVIVILVSEMSKIVLLCFPLAPVAAAVAVPFPYHHLAANELQIP